MTDGMQKKYESEGGGWGRLLDFSDDAKCWQGFIAVARISIHTRLTPAYPIILYTPQVKREPLPRSATGCRSRGGARRRTANRAGPHAFSLIPPVIRTGSRKCRLVFKNLARRAPRSKASSSALHATRSPHSDLREIGREAGVAKAPSPFIYRR